MKTHMEAVQRRFSRLGWSMVEKNLATTDGGSLWLVLGRRKGQVFAAHAATRSEAWESAWDLARQLHLTVRRARTSRSGKAVVPFSAARSERVA